MPAETTTAPAPNPTTYVWGCGRREGRRRKVERQGRDERRRPRTGDEPDPPLPDHGQDDGEDRPDDQRRRAEEPPERGCGQSVPRCCADGSALGASMPRSPAPAGDHESYLLRCRSIWPMNANASPTSPSSPCFSPWSAAPRRQRGLPALPRRRRRRLRRPGGPPVVLYRDLGLALGGSCRGLAVGSRATPARDGGNHPDLFHDAPKAELVALVDDLKAKLATATDDELMVGVTQIVARVSAKGRDSHTGLFPWNPASRSRSAACPPTVALPRRRARHRGPRAARRPRRRPAGHDRGAPGGRGDQGALDPLSRATTRRPSAS